LRKHKSSPLTYQAIIKDLEAKKYAPIYLLHGEESYYIDAISHYIEKNVLNEGEKAFNQAVLYGKEIEFKQVVDEARQFPMMAPYRVIIIKEAQEMRTLSKLEQYASNPSPTSILVIAHKHKKIDKRTRFVKNASKSGIVMESKRIYDNQLPGWITEHLKSKSVTIDYEASQLLADYLGTDLSKVSNELEKLLLNISNNKITADDVQEQVGISKDYNVFELQKAIGNRDGAKVFRIINYFSENEKNHPLPLVIGNLYNYFSKLYITIFNLKTPDNQLQRLIGLPSPYFVKEYKASARILGYDKIRTAFIALQQADLQSKGVGSRNKDSKAILTELALALIY
jgi:DNA polymerase-3 subunit delta